MSREYNKPLIARLSLAIATGKSVTAWAKENDVLPRTARNWGRLPEVRAATERHRQRIVDQVVGKLVRHAMKAVDQLARLATEGDNDGIRLNAAKALLDKLIEVQNHAATMREIGEINNRLDTLEKATNASPTQ